MGSKRKEALKMAQWALEQANKRTSKLSTIEDNDKLISSLESAFGNLEVKSNWPEWWLPAGAFIYKSLLCQWMS